MLLRNYYNQLTSMFTNQVIANGIKAPDGTLYASSCPSNSSTVMSYSVVAYFKGLSNAKGSYGSLYLNVGSGSTPVSVDDYKLDSIITTNMNAAFTMSLDNDGNFVIVASFYNTHTEAITIKEVGISGRCFYDSTNYKDCLVERTVLDEPITVPAKGSCFISYKIRFAPTLGAFPS